MTAADLTAFESDIRAEWEAGNLPCLLHLCGGNEEKLVEIFGAVRPGDWIFSTHRNHFHALLAGIPPARVKAEIMAGRSMFVFRNLEKHPEQGEAASKGCNFYSSAILAGTCCIAAGVAHALKSHPSYPSHPSHVWCFLGDGAAENGHVWEAINFVEGHDLPCTFIIEDNDRQVDTNKLDRRGSRSALDAALEQFHCVRRYAYTPTYPHAGSGAKPGTITFKPAAIARMKER